MKVGILASHPIQYHVPWFRMLARCMELVVFFAHRPTPTQQGKGFGTAFEWDVDLLTGYESHFLSNNARLPATDSFWGCSSPDIKVIVKNGNFDAFILCGWNLRSYWQSVSACSLCNIPVVVRGDSRLASTDSPIRRALKALVYPWMLKSFDGFLFVGTRNAEYLRHYGVPQRKMFFAPHFVDNDWFSERAAVESARSVELRDKWGASHTTSVALYAGKFVEKKRPADYLRGLAHARARGANVIGVFVGAGSLDTSLRALAKDLRVPIEFAGFRNQTEMPLYYRASDFLVLPSDGRETWGLVVNEAMACGLPAIVSDQVGCAPDLIEEGHTGFTYPQGDFTALGESVGRLCELRQQGYDFAPYLRRKLRTYAVGHATMGTVQALRAVCVAPSKLN